MLRPILDPVRFKTCVLKSIFLKEKSQGSDMTFSEKDLSERQRGRQQTPAIDQTTPTNNNYPFWVAQLSLAMIAAHWKL